MGTSAVQGFMFVSVDESDPQNNHVCSIVRRALLSDEELRDMGPAFTVEFGNGTRRTAFADELRPWYPT